MRIFFLGVCCFFSLFGLAQEDAETNTVKAIVKNAQTDEPMESVHVVNLNQVVGTITNEQGEFSITAAVNDTLYFTYLGFKSQKNQGHQ